MKFTDGYWSRPKNVKAAHPAQVYDVDVAQDSFTVYAPTMNITHRGETHDGTLLTVNFSSPLPDVIRGYGHVKDESLKKYEQELAKLLASFDSVRIAKSA